MFILPVLTGIIIFRNRTCTIDILFPCYRIFRIYIFSGCKVAGPSSKKHTTVGSFLSNGKERFCGPAAGGEMRGWSNAVLVRGRVSSEKPAGTDGPNPAGHSLTGHFPSYIIEN